MPPLTRDQIKKLPLDGFAIQGIGACAQAYPLHSPGLVESSLFQAKNFGSDEDLKAVIEAVKIKWPNADLSEYEAEE